MFEFEKKVMLNKAEYYSLIQMMPLPFSTVVQTNYYFDTDDYAMDRKGVTCRIRSKNGTFRSVIKSHDMGISDCSAETTIHVQKRFDPTFFQDMGLCLQGALLTKRTVIYRDELSEAVLDHNFYLGCEDYELEVEYSKEKDDHAMGVLLHIAEMLFRDRQIESVRVFCSRIGKGNNKSERFFSRKRLLAEETR